MVRSCLLSIVCFAMLAAGPLTPAYGDEDEASFNGQLLYGLACVGDEDAGRLTDTVDFLGFGARATYANNNWYAYELQVSYANLARSAYFDDEAETLYRRMSWLRVDAGISARLGVRLIPIVNASIGTQLRFAGSGRIVPVEPPGPTVAADKHVTLEFVGTLGLGVDFRPADYWVFGILGTVQSAVSDEPRFQAIGGMVHLAHYFYWFP